MKKINKNNYEAYLLDLIEGNLGTADRHELLAFLAENPGLKAAFEGDFGDVVLKPEEIAFTNKSGLKVPDSNVLSLQTVEQWMLESVEKNLTPEQEKQLARFIKANRLEKTVLAYQSTRLKPDPGITYAQKHELKVRDGLVIPLYVRLAAAAAVLLLLSLAVGKTWFGSQPLQPLANGVKLAPFDFSGLSEENVAVTPVDPAPQQNNTGLQGNEERRRNGLVTDPLQPGNKLAFEKENTRKDSLGITGNPLITPGDDMVRDTHDEVPADDGMTENNATAEDEIVSSGPAFKSEQPYKLITDVASDVINKEVYFSRQKDVVSDQYVAYQFRLGSFEFERKKSR